MRSIESALMRAWLRRGVLACLLWPLSQIFWLILLLRRQWYQRGWLASWQAPVPVIVVGNIFIGGTGKTPFTIWLLDVLKQAGYRPGVISRGHGVANHAPMIIDAQSTVLDGGDEPVLIAWRSNCPVAVGRQRVMAARHLLQSFPSVDVIVADDGLQHSALRRDLEIVMFDQRGVGNGWLLPAGPLRESATRRRDFTVWNTNDEIDLPAQAFAMRLNGDYAYALADPRQRVALSELSAHQKQHIVAAAGIGNPARFFALLSAAQLNFASLPLPDHYDFRANPFAKLRADMILITEKDAVKCCRIDAIRADSRIWVVPVEAQVDPQLAEKILEKLRGFPSA